MKGKNLLILISAAALLTAAAVITSIKNRPKTPDIAVQRVLPDLPVNDINKVVIISPQRTITVIKSNDTWIIPDKQNHPANFEAVKSLIIKLADMKIDHVSRLTEKQKKGLSLISPEATIENNEFPPGTLIKLLDTNDKSIANILIGSVLEQKMDEPGGFKGIFPAGHYVTTDNGKSVYFVSTLFNEIFLKPEDWLEQNKKNDGTKKNNK